MTISYLGTYVLVGFGKDQVGVVASAEHQERICNLLAKIQRQSQNA